MCIRVIELKICGIMILILCCIINDLCNLKFLIECNYYEIYFIVFGLIEIKVIFLYDCK